MSPVGKTGRSASIRPKGIDDAKPEKPAEPMGQSAPEFSPDFGLKEVDWKGAAAGYMQVEAMVILKWLNRFVVSRAFDTEAFPSAIIDNHGDIVVEFIEQISGRKIPGIKAGAGEEPQPKGGPSSKDKNKDAAAGALARRPSRQQIMGSKIATSQRLVEKYRIILNFLIQGGALLNHINAMDLLSKEHFVLAQEVDLRKIEGSRLTPAMLDELKIQWSACWASNR